MSKTNNQAAIVGIGQTEFSKDSGRSEQQLAAEAVIPPAKTPALILKKLTDALPTPLITLMKLTFFVLSGARS